MPMGKVFRSLLAVLTGFCGAFAANAEPDSTSSGIVRVKIFQVPNPSNDSPGSIADYKVLQRFHELYPNIRLWSDTPLQIEGAAGDAETLLAINGDAAPDILLVNFRRSGTYISKGILYPLDEYIAQLSPEEIAERIPETVRPVVYRAGPSGQKHYWTVPTEIAALVLFYRKDLFARAGLDPNHPPGDWNELWECAEKTADPGQGVYGVAFYSAASSGWNVFPYLTSAGARVLTEQPDGDWKATFDSEEAVHAFAFVDKLLLSTVTKNDRSGPIAYRGMEDHNRLFQEGRLAMHYNYLGSRVIGYLDPAVWGIAPMPKGPTGISSAEVNANMLGIFAGVKDKRVRDAAWEYIRFVGSKEARRVYTEAMVELGAAQALNPLYLEEFGYSYLAKRAAPEFVEAYRHALRNGTPEPYARNCQFVYNYLSRPLDKLYYTKFESPGSRLETIRSILKEAVRETNEQMLGEIPPEVRKTRNAVSWVVATVVLCAFFVFIGWVFFWMSRRLRFTASEPRRNLLALAFLAPALILVLWWQYYPLIRGLLIAFQDYNIMGSVSWVGINNFADVFYDRRFWSSLVNAGYFCVLWMLMGFLPPVVLAIILQEIPRGKLLFRVLFYIPAVVSGVVILLMWNAIYDPSPDGILNRGLRLIGIPAQTWLSDPGLAMICVVFPIAWGNLGPGSIIYLAALKVIPGEVFEASDMDGAGFLTKVTRIALPYLKPLLLINAIGAIIFGFKSSDAILAMTGGGPDDATQVVGYEIWQRSFLFLQFGQATAMAWVLALLLLAFTAHLMRVQARVEFRTAA